MWGGEKILGVSLVANEAVEHLHRVKKERSVVKLDFEKLYDRVKWGL